MLPIEALEDGFVGHKALVSGDQEASSGHQGCEEASNVRQEVEQVLLVPLLLFLDRALLKFKAVERICY